MQAETRNRSCLHLVVKSTSGALEGCRSQFETGDSVLFLDDGVMHIMKVSDELLGLPVNACYFASPDLAARGLSAMAVAAGVREMTDEDFAELVPTHDLCLTWK